MQILQTKYSQHSAHYEYLNDCNLIDQEQVHYDKLEYHQQSQLHFQQKSIQSQQTYDMTFEEFVIYSTHVKRWHFGQKLQTILVKIVICLVGEIFQSEYYKLKTRQNQLKRSKIPSIYLLVHLITLLLFLSYYYLEITIFIVSYLCLFQITSEIQSQLNKSQNIKHQIAIQIIKLKSKYIQQIFIMERAIESLIKMISKQFYIPVKVFAFKLDSLDSMIHDVNQNVKVKNKRFLIEQNWLKRKLTYWEIFYYNRKLVQLLANIKNILLLPLKDGNNQRLTNPSKSQVQSSIYYQILINRLQQERINVLQKGHHPQKLAKLIYILKKQVQFKRIFFLRNHDYSKESSYQIPKQMEPQISSFHQQQKEQIKSLCYYEDKVESYQPQDSNLIKQKLQQILKQRLNSISQNIVCQNTEVNSQKIVSNPPEATKRQMISFGIGIMPPKRDMSAYYLQ